VQPLARELVKILDRRLRENLTRHAGDCRHLRNEIEQLPDLRRVALPGRELLAVNQYRQLAHIKNLVLIQHCRRDEPPVVCRHFSLTEKPD
jgi:hypothetical protein